MNYCNTISCEYVKFRQENRKEIICNFEITKIAGKPVMERSKV
jgi:hypothetical protein